MHNRKGTRTVVKSTYLVFVTVIVLWTAAWLAKINLDVSFAWLTTGQGGFYVLDNRQDHPLDYSLPLAVKNLGANRAGGFEPSELEELAWLGRRVGAFNCFNRDYPQLSFGQPDSANRVQLFPAECHCDCSNL